jgi:hypothetical protein
MAVDCSTRRTGPSGAGAKNAPFATREDFEQQMAGGLIKARQTSDAALEKNGTTHAPAWGAAQAPDEHGSSIPWNRYFAALRRYKWLMLAVIVAGTALGVAATRLSKPVYEVQATIWISQAEPRYGRDETGPIQAEELVNPGAWIELFKSFAVLDSVVTKMSLYRSVEDPRDSVAFAGFALGDRFRPGSYSLTSDAARQQYVLATKDGVEIERSAPPWGIPSDVARAFAGCRRGNYRAETARSLSRSSTRATSRSPSRSKSLPC